MKRKKLPSLKTLKTKLDKVFSIYIRHRDTESEGMGFCVTCGEYRKLECGHFVRRQHVAVRWDDRNAAGQCYYCNHRLHGNEAEYYTVLIKRYGQEVVDELMRLKHTTAKLTRSDLEELIKRYS